MPHFSSVKTKGIMDSMGDSGSSHSPQHKILPYDLDSGFEPQTRARSNTWPLPRPEGYVDSIGKEGIVDGNGSLQQQTLGQGAGSLMPAVKKNSSRRNAWGNLSYADLITQAITSAPEKRLTLSQIYEWMVQNVPYFKDKGDSNSSAGWKVSRNFDWKNSIRHNLSLHNRFMRVQNEGTGKSSWWMINPDAKPGKSARRRATSMEANNYEKRRGRAKKRVENVRNNVVQADAASSPSSSVSEGLDLFSESPLHTTSGFPLSPEFRPRASSNASSAGRLSPIPSHMNETEWPTNYVASYSPEQLAGNLAETMKLEPYQMQYQSPPPPNHQQPTVQPPSYFEAQYQINSMRNPTPSYTHSTCRAASQQRCSIHLHPCTCSMNSNSVSDLSPTYQQSDSSPSPLNGVHQSSQQPKKPVQQQKIKQRSPQTIGRNSSPPQTPPSVPSAACTMMGQLMGALNSNLLDDLNISIEGLQGGFDCNVDEVIKHELSMDGTLDFNFQHGLIDTTSIHVNNADITQGNVITSNNPVTSISGNAPTDIYVSTNPTTPSVLNPSWVH